MKRRNFLKMSAALVAGLFITTKKIEASVPTFILKVIWYSTKKIFQSLTVKEVAKYTVEAIEETIATEGLFLVIKYEFGYDSITMKNKSGKEIAYAGVLEKTATKGFLSVDIPSTNQSFSRKGYAKILYYLISKKYGKYIIASTNQTKSGKKLWENELMKIPGGGGHVDVKIDGKEFNLKVFRAKWFSSSTTKLRFCGIFF